MDGGDEALGSMLVTSDMEMKYEEVGGASESDACHCRVGLGRLIQYGRGLLLNLDTTYRAGYILTFNVSAFCCWKHSMGKVAAQQNWLAWSIQ